MTTIREFFTKLVKADDSAQKMMDANLERNQVRFMETSKGVYKLTNDLTKGSKLTADAISNIAQDDATQAVNIMSQLVGKNLLDMETLIKVFNGRYGLIVSNMLRTINGDIEGYVENINESTSLTEDLAKQQNNLNNQWQVFKNRLFGANSETVNIAKNMGNLLGLMGNGVLNIFNTDLGRMAFSFISTATAIGLMGVGISKLTNLIKIATVETGVWGAVMNAVPFMALVTAISLAVSGIMHYASKQQEARDKMADATKQIEANNKSITELNKEYKAISDTIEQFNISNITNGFGDINSVMSTLTGTTNGLKDSVRDLYALLDKTPTADKVVDAENTKLKNQKAFYQQKLKELQSESNALEQKYSTPMTRKMLDEMYAQAKEYELKISTIDKSLGEYKNKFKLEQQAILEEQALGAEKFNQEYSSAIYSDIMNIASKYKTKKKEDLFSYLLGIPELKNYSKQFIDKITSMDKIIKPDRAFTLSEMQDPKYLEYIMNVSDAYGAVTEAQKEYDASRTKTNLDILSTTKARLSSMIEGHKIENQSTEKTKKDETTKMEILDLSTKYNEELIKTLKFNSDDLTILRDKRAELQRMYEMRAEESRGNIKSEFGYTGAFTEKALKEELKRLETQKKAIESAYPEKSKMPTVKSDEYKNIVEGYKAIDEYLASIVSHGKDLKSIENDRVNLLKTEKSNLFEYLKASEEIYATQLQLNELQNERLSIGRSESDNYKAELDLITNRYEYEMKMLKMKRDYLLGTYGLSMNNLESERDSILNIQRGGITALGKGFASGGYTGDGGKYEPAGIVHSGEIVFSKENIKNLGGVGAVESIRNGMSGYYNGGLVGAMLKSNKDKNAVTMPLDKDKTSLPLYGMDSFLKGFGFSTYGKPTLNAKKKRWEQTFDNGIDRMLSVIYDGNKKEFYIKQTMRKLKNNQKTGSGDASVVQKILDIKAEELAQGSEKFNGSKNTFGTGRSGTASSNVSSGANSTTSSKSTTTSTNNTPLTQPKTTFSLVNSFDTIIEKLTDVSLKLPDLIDTSLKNIDSLSLDDNTTLTGEGRLPTKEEQAKLSAIYELMASINQEEMLREQIVQSIVELSMKELNNNVELAKTASEHLAKIEELSGYKDRMYNSDAKNEKYNLKLKQDALDLQAKDIDYSDSIFLEEVKAMDKKKQSDVEKLKNSKEYAKMNKDEQVKAVELINLQYESAKASFDTNYKKEQKIKLDEYEIALLIQQNDLLDYQYKKHSAITSAVMSLVENVASGKGMSFDISQVRDSAMKSFTKVASGGTANSSDYLSMGSYVAGIVDQFAQSEFASKQESLSWEQKILDLRLQGAKTETEKLAIEQQQYELQVQALELAYQQQTSFMGISGVGGSALSGGLSMANTMSGMSSMLGMSASSAGWLGAGLGVAMGISSALDAKENLKLQMEQLETQRDIAEYNEDMASQMKTMNDILSTMASLGGTIGIENAMNSIISSIQMNPTKYNISGSGKSDWFYVGESDFWGNESTSWQSETSTQNLASFGLKTSDLDSLSDYSSLLTNVNKKLASVTALKNAWVASNSFGGDSSSNYAKEVLAEYQAQVQALGAMADNIQTIINLMKTMASVSFQSSFGATLKETYAEDGETITGYYSNWDDFMSSTFSSAYTDATTKILKSANSITSTLFSGLGSIFTANYSNMTSISNKLKTLYTNLSNTLSSNLTAMSNTAINKSIKSMITLASDYNNEQTAINNKVNTFINLWLNNGGAISDIYDSLTEGAKGIYDSMETALGSDSYETLLSDLGSSVGTTFMDSFKSKLMDTSGLTSVFQDLYAQLNTSVTDLSVQSASNLMSAITTASVALDYQARQVEAISSIFDTTSKLTYSNDEISYSTGTTKSTNNYYTITSNMNSDVVFTDDQASVNYFCTSIASNIKNALTEIGADL